jgi:DNA modification methylase
LLSTDFEFFNENDISHDFIAGSNTICCVAEPLHRRWLALENVEDYLKAGKFSFD